VFVSARLGRVVKPVAQVISSLLTTITDQVKPEKFSDSEVGAKWDVPPNPTAIIQTGSQRTNGFTRLFPRFAGGIHSEVLVAPGPDGA
jgi:hypothetical protein